ncbi:nucleotide exchange factor GrpE [Paenibacillus tarimensis]|uniref:nucleotide exchange factor GrpE n=1 Tax=Paenibacillus tarimensis TaxID=416012 RepID=UPI001F202395|nr:nucleotide exchange factor GrpE [Paenibacillus tarimensis]MCF2942034.1 nucleotide exchange factor GrpE [Paenibacillus tarimensis]
MAEQEKVNTATEQDETLNQAEETQDTAGVNQDIDSREEAEETVEATQTTDREKELEQLVEEHQQRLLRTQADYDNFRRRTQKEKEELAQYASMKLVGQLLPVMDNFERAIGASKESGDFDALSKGVDMIFRQMAQLLEQEGLRPMESVGQPFNPEFHQAVMTVESDEYEEGTVVEELQKGYMLKEKVLRPAMVKVSG